MGSNTEDKINPSNPIVESMHIGPTGEGMHIGRLDMSNAPHLRFDFQLPLKKP